MIYSERNYLRSPDAFWWAFNSALTTQQQQSYICWESQWTGPQKNKEMKRRIQDFGQGVPAGVFTLGGPERKFPHNCLKSAWFWKKILGQGALRSASDSEMHWDSRELGLLIPTQFLSALLSKQWWNKGKYVVYVEPGSSVRATKVDFHRRMKFWMNQKDAWEPKSLLSPENEPTKWTWCSSQNDVHLIPKTDVQFYFFLPNRKKKILRKTFSCPK